MVQRGQGMAADIAEQPAGFARLLEGPHAAAIAEVAAEVARRSVEALGIERGPVVVHLRLSGGGREM